MAYVHQYSDRVNKPRLASKSDMDILIGRSNAVEAEQNMADKYEQVLQQRDEEAARRYPNSGFIARCNKILENLRPVYMKVRGQ